jgi:hypothetical protein
MQIKIDTSSFKALEARIMGMGKQVNYATAVALTKTAKLAQAAMPAALDKALDRPTPFTKSSVFVTPANKNNLAATIGFKDRAATYMQRQIEGGTLTPGKGGLKLPGDIVLNAFGNIPRGMINKLKAAAQSGQLSKAIGKRLGLGNRRKGAAPIQLFYGKPTGAGWEQAPMGIWRRIPGTSGGKGKLVPVILFEDTAFKYKPRFRFRDEVEKVVRAEWPGQFNAALDEAIRTAR